MVRLRRHSFTIIAVAVVLTLFFLGSIVNTIVDLLWFSALGYKSVFWTGLKTRLLLRVVTAVVMFFFFFVNLRLAATSFGSIRRRICNIEIHEEVPARYLNLIAIAGAAFLAFLFSAVAGTAWLDVLAYFHRQPFGQIDPMFGRDIGFYIFSLPVYRMAQNLAFLLVVAALIILAIVYITSGGLEIDNNRIRLKDTPLRHLVAIMALLFLVLAWGFRLDLYELVYSSRGVVYGASYTDAGAQVLGYRVLAVLALAAFGMAAYDFVRRRYVLTLTAAGAVILGMVIFKGLYPGAVQQFEVEPNEIGKEALYIARNIELTRRAFDLDAIEVRPFEVSDAAVGADLQQAEGTLSSIRLWDSRPLLDTYSQLQKLRLYYEFEDVDVDRYDLGSGPRQVMLAGREMAVDELATNVQTWQNQHLIFTHGYGLVISPVNEVTREGLPVFYLSDIPPSAAPGLADVLRVERPEIYYGERTSNYVLAATREQEFDYPRGDQNIYTSYSGEGGLEVDALWRKALFSWYMGSIKFLLTDDITPDTRLMFFRQIQQRTQRLAPFLSYDLDPYLVLLDGRLLWVIDAYTISSRYPYSEPVRGFGGRQQLNYIRNSVKVVIDAYHGDVTFFAWDEEDPILAAYRSIFPDLFRSAAEMPAGLEAHLRYPEDLFLIQAEVLRVYHMQDPRVFYNREDMWNIPNEVYQGQPTKMVPYYVLLRLPDDSQPAFQLVLPFTPTRRDNMVALLAAKSDPGDYGRRVIYEFPKDRLIFGPMQIEARIDQDPTISEQITLWSQKGSNVIRGNLLVIPIGKSVLYVEPLFLQAQQSQLPELRRVIATYGTQIVMEPTLEDAMLALIRGASPAAEAEVAEIEAPPEAAPTPGERSLASQAQTAYERAGEAQRRGDWAAYGAALEELGRILEQLTESEQ